MGRIVMGVRQDYRCKLSDIPTATECDAKDCATCGWNPEVNRRRRAELYRYAKEKRLQEWGVAEEIDGSSDLENKNLDV